MMTVWEAARAHRRLMRAAARSARHWPESMVLELVALAYESAGDASRWPAFLTRLQDAVGAVGGGLVYHDFKNSHGALSISVRMDAGYVESYQRYYCLIDPTMATIGQLLSAAPIFGPIGTFITRHEMRQSEFYADWLRPQRVLANLSGAIFYDGSVASGFDLYRSLHAEDYGLRECGLLHVLMPHLRRALELHQRLEGFGRLHDAAEDVLEALALGVILIDASGRVVFTNRAARAHLGRRDGMWISDRQLRAMRRDDEDMLRSAVHSAARTGAGQGVGTGGSLSVRRPSGKQPYALLVSPLRTRDARLERARTAAVVFISDPEDRAVPAVEILQRLYGLTPTEAHVCALSVAGVRVVDIADALGTSRATVSTHVKRILHKSGARRQSDLVRLVLQGPAGLVRTEVTPGIRDSSSDDMVEAAEHP